MATEQQHPAPPAGDGAHPWDLMLDGRHYPEPHGDQWWCAECLQLLDGDDGDCDTLVAARGWRDAALRAPAAELDHARCIAVVECLEHSDGVDEDDCCRRWLAVEVCPGTPRGGNAPISMIEHATAVGRCAKCYRLTWNPDEVHGRCGRVTRRDGSRCNGRIESASGAAE